MADQLIVLGNGFDLKCGLKSSYSNFFEWLYTKDEKTDRLEKEEIVYKNFWMQLFYNLHEVSGNWADIELAIETALIFVDENYEYCIKDYVEAIRKWYSPHAIYSYDIYLEVVKERGIETSGSALYDAHNGTLSSSLIPSSILMEDLTKDDILIASLILSRIHYSNNKNKSVYVIKEFFEILLKDLYLFEKEFELFLIDSQGGKYKWEANCGAHGYFRKSCILLEKIFDADMVCSQANIFSFNYTTPYNKNLWELTSNFYINKLERVEKVVNVHGLASKKSTDNNNVIFGIDNKEYNSEDLEYPFTKTFRTMVMYSDSSKPSYTVEENVFDENIKTIKFYGHSLAEADYSYFQAMFDYYDLYNNNELMLYFYFSTHGNKTSQEMILEQADRVTKLIEKYGKTLDNKNHGKNLLTRLIQTKRLFIKEI